MKQAINARAAQGMPQEGFMRLKEVLRIFPISKTSWFAGVKAGKYPQPVKHGHCAFYAVADIRNLIDGILNAKAGC